MRKLLLIIAITALYSCVYAQNYEFVYNTNCKEAYSHFMNLESDEGYQALKSEFVNNPRNLMATYIGDYEDCLLLLFNGNPLDYSERKHHLDDRLKIIDKYKGSSPWYRLSKAGLYMHWAFVELKFNQKLKAANYFRKSFQLLKENNKLYPEFEYNSIFQGINEAAVGAIPDNYRWIASIFGMSGNVNNGIAKVEHFINTHNDDDPLYREAIIYYTYMLYYLKHDKQKSWDVISRLYKKDKGLVTSFVKANIALNYHKAAEAEKVLQNATQNRYYKQYPIFDYEYGYAFLHKLDSRAISKFHSFLKNYKGGIFVKDSWYRMGQLYHLSDDEKNKAVCKKNILEQGTAITDSDKQALRHAQESGWGQPLLIKAQLLTDGGYYKRAYYVLIAEEATNSVGKTHPLEYSFRLGRVYDELDEKDTAIRYYKHALDIGENSKEQFGARAALQLGFLYENSGHKSLAVNMYQKAISIDDHDFENSIEQQAKAGLNRLGFRN